MNPPTQLSSVNLITLVIHSVLCLAPSIRTSKACAVSLPYLICIAGLALSDLIGLTRLSWVCSSHSRTSAESGLLPPLCICIISQIEWFVKGFPTFFLRALADRICEATFSLPLTPIVYHTWGGLSSRQSAQLWENSGIDFC